MRNKRKNIKGLSGFLCLLCMLTSINVYAEETEENVKDNNRTYYSDAYWAGHDDDFSEEGPIDSDDYNYGWSLGKFSVSGYSTRMEDAEGNYIFLKNVGDKINLTFVLEQEIHCLNGNKKLYIRELDPRDEYFQTQNIDFGHGALILRHTDYEGTKHEPIIYSNYLEALEVGTENKISIDGPNTNVYLLEEGDYEVALDYRIGKEKDGPLFINPKDPYQDFRIFFKFSIRNGNCMTYIRDVTTGSELTNESVTKNGFVVDMANPNYLQVIIKKEVMSDGRDGLIEDTRFNRPISDGEKFTEEGMYTLTTKNIYTNEQTIKKIYVGTDEVMIAYVNSQYSIEEINSLLEQGCIINDDGTIEYPVVEEIAETTEKQYSPIDATSTNVNDTLSNNSNKNIFEKIKDYFLDNIYQCVGIVIALFMLIVMLFVSVKKQKKKKG